ncbi:hypothetical protein NPIL_397851 [Nephila pilipes]|uniref:Uncharacterized protein n=1 Tax=Nephila pilipes TaxID=299642 RepID=A0A8X6N6W2_NEPPI|nr:hypothetical protein NPIL_397851 [Nephila pilipes]
MLHISVSANELWVGITSRFLLYEIKATTPMEELSKELKQTNYLVLWEIRFVKSRNRHDLFRVLITILRTSLSENVKLYFINNRVYAYLLRTLASVTPVSDFSIPSVSTSIQQ